MGHRERMLLGQHGFDWHFWIFSGEVAFNELREVKKPRWLALLLCKFGKHAWWLDSEPLRYPLIYKCEKCGMRNIHNAPGEKGVLEKETT